MASIEDLKAAGFTQAEIDQYVAEQQKTAPAPTTGQVPAGVGREAAIAGSGLLSGIVNTVGIPAAANGFLANQADTVLPGAGKYVKILGFGSPQIASHMTTAALTADVNSLGEKAGVAGGLLNRSDLTPQGTWEKLLAGGAAGLGGAIVTGGLSVPAALAGIAGGVGGSAAAEAYPDSKFAPVLGGLAAGGTVGGLANLFTKTVNGIRGLLTPQAQQFVTAGIPIRSAALVSDNPLTKGLLSSGAPIEQTQQDIAQSLENHAGSISPVVKLPDGTETGSPRTLQQAGTIFQQHAHDWLDNILPAKDEAIWSPIDSQLPGAPTGLDNYTQALEGITNKAVSPEAQKMLDSINPSGVSKQLAALRDAQQTSGAGSIQTKNPINGRVDFNPAPLEIPWQDSRKLRSAIGEAYTNPDMIRSIGRQDLDRMYAAITADQRQTAENAGLGNQFDQANKLSSNLRNFAENRLGKIISPNSASDPDPEKVAKQLLGSANAGGSELEELRQQIPGGVDALAAAHLRQIGLDTPDSMDSAMAKNFAGKFKTLSPEGKTALFGDRADSIQAAADIADRLKTIPTGKGSVSKALPYLGLVAGGASGFLHGLGGNDLAPSEVGAGIGAAIPMIGKAGQSLLARSQTLANGAAIPGAGINPLMPLVGGVSGNAAGR